MATKRPSFLKRQKEQKRSLRALEKRQARQARKEAKPLEEAGLPDQKTNDEGAEETPVGGI